MDGENSMNESNEPKLSMNRRDALKGSQQCGDCSHLTDLRGAKDWDGFGATFQSPAWPISFFTAARWGRIFELIGGGSWCAFFSFIRMGPRSWS